MNNMLDYIQANGDLKKFDSRELKELCNDIRSFLIESVSKTGGHLASNLGVVELTVAVHRVFDLPGDKLIFDVGHQSYVHKLLTGRKDRFDKLRQFGGISGFPKRSESEFDAFDTGHSSTSVSAALGMARARDLNGEKHNIIAILGDGALTGGEIYESLNDAGRTKTPLILILNDNNMSISRNVGAMSKHLRNIRISRYYFKSKKKISGFLRRVPLAGTPVRRIIESIKASIRKRVLPTTLFDELGFKYIGPMNGHDINALIDCLEYAKSEKKPVIIHACTIKGMGYAPAQKNPSAFHGVGKFDPLTGELLPGQGSYSSRFGETIVRLAKYNPKVCAITCAMPDGTGLTEFSKQFRDRFFDVGIAEQHGVTLAAGMAAAGMIPVIPLYSTFLQRSFDQVLHDVCLQNLHVVFPIDRAGLVGADGETHQGVYDISFLSCMPNMTVLAPSSFEQLDEMLTYAVERHRGPIAIRYPRGGTQSPYPSGQFEINKAYINRKGCDVSIITSGRMIASAAEIAKKLEDHNISAEITELPTVHPINVSAVIAAAMKTGFVITLEDNVKSGGFGEHIAEILIENSVDCRFKAFGFPNEPIVHGTVADLDKKYGVDADTVTKYIIKVNNSLANCSIAK
ncbi:MAG: 1-deoxy-D-xylulose-5-phosphate synthase [Oscillospiraceae bacterium]|nr:1-deoxy-D-xylulose-5-phosphate synthase [Oscillospiraceae bacterium]